MHGLAGMCLLIPVAAVAHSMQRNPNQKKNNINYHLSRMYPKIIGPHKRN